MVTKSHLRYLLVLVVLFTLMAVSVPSIYAQDAGTSCGRPQNHPLVARIEREFGVTFDQYSFWYCQGVTLTAISQALELSRTTGVSFDVYLNILISRTDYSQVLAELGVSLNDLAPGKILFR